MALFHVRCIGRFRSIAAHTTSSLQMSNIELRSHTRDIQQPTLFPLLAYYLRFADDEKQMKGTI